MELVTRRGLLRKLDGVESWHKSAHFKCIRFGFLRLVERAHQILLGLLQIGFSGIMTLFSESPVITAFRQSENELAIGLRNAPDDWNIKIYSKVPTHLSNDVLVCGRFTAGVQDRILRIPLQLESSDQEYSILVHTGKHYFELIRQSASWLKITFNFELRQGFTTLGRRSIQIELSPFPRMEPICFVGKPPRQQSLAAELTEHVEVNQAAALLRSIWSEPIHVGPTAKSYVWFSSQSYETKLNVVRSGDFRVTCQGLRDLFVHASLADESLKIRPIDLYSYGPQIGELIGHTHAATEVYVSALTKWVLVDPWMGIALAGRRGLVGAFDVVQTNNSDVYQVVPLLDSQTRITHGIENQIKIVTLRPVETDIKAYSISTLGHSPDYLSYFNHVLVRDVRVVAKPWRAIVIHVIGVALRICTRTIKSMWLNCKR